MTGSWQGGEYLFQITRSMQVDSQSLEDWVGGDLQQLGVSTANVRYAKADNVRIAVVTPVKDAESACPVAYVYLWTANPAGRNVRQAMGVISQAPGIDVQHGSPECVCRYLCRTTRQQQRTSRCGDGSSRDAIRNSNGGSDRSRRWPLQPGHPDPPAGSAAGSSTPSHSPIRKAGHWTGWATQHTYRATI